MTQLGPFDFDGNQFRDRKQYGEYGEPWATYLAHDFVSSAPSVTYVVCKSPGVKHSASSTRRFVDIGRVLAEEILSLPKRWNAKAFPLRKATA